VRKTPHPDDYRTLELYEDAVNAYKDFCDASDKAVQEAMLTEPRFATNSEFIKLDSGKRRLSLIEPQFINTLGDVITFGAEKYAPENWRLCEDTSRYKDALLRHIYAYLSGEQKDQETGIDHLAHAACNLMFLQYFDNLKKDQQ